MTVARPMRFRMLSLTLVASIALVVVAITGASSAAAAGTWWHLSSTAAPTNLPAGGEAQIVASASNLGYEEAGATLTLSDKLPPGVELVPGSLKGSEPSKRTNLQRGAKGNGGTPGNSSHVPKLRRF